MVLGFIGELITKVIKVKMKKDGLVLANRRENNMR